MRVRGEESRGTKRNQEEARGHISSDGHIYAKERFKGLLVVRCLKERCLVLLPLSIGRIEDVTGEPFIYVGMVLSDFRIGMIVPVSLGGTQIALGEFRVSFECGFATLERKQGATHAAETLFNVNTPPES